ncbi:cytochrome b [Ramlibacter sp. Leaf400]|uniref:cytochrome b n=1 Tax=Ramlibacter sp. Leaf400 TaxID=1736365 RepID=UPI0006F7127D|nr:cytochrome b [Ramlibacter sp. Leaf400]KQT10317.1 cytochrome B [Ramlibacter sp. Leaf400]
MDRPQPAAFMNTATRYGWVAIVLHWAMALALLALFVSGVWMVGLPDVGFDRTKITWILLHKAVGVAALIAVALRLAWRAANPLPHLAAGLPEWQRFAARLAHLCLYGFMVAIPLSGWLMSSAGGYPVSVLGLFDLPALVPVNEQHFHAWVAVHQWLAYAFALLVAVHAAAALRHHFVLRDDSLRRMLPGRYEVDSATSRASSASASETA